MNEKSERSAEQVLFQIHRKSRQKPGLSAILERQDQKKQKKEGNAENM